MDKNETPNSLHHYTSMGTLVALFNGIGKNKNDEKDLLYFSFHASNACQMNDKIEGKMLLNKFFTESKIKMEYKKLYTQMEIEEGELHIISFCKSDEKSKNTGNIPMWSMYGNKGNGAILVFDYKKLKEYISKHQNMSLYKCQYKNSQELQELTRKKNHEIKDTDNKVHFLSTLRIEAFDIKDRHWEYENEWRILVKSHNTKLKSINNGAISYTEVQIPVNCLSAIIIGPLVESDLMERIFNKKISKLHELDNSINISVKSSKLQIR